MLFDVAKNQSKRIAGILRRGIGSAGMRTRSPSADVSIFHEFVPPPTGGGHQFMRALRVELHRRGFTTDVNRVAPGTRVCLFNSYNFNFRKLRRLGTNGCRMVHRVDGPIGVYRGHDDGTDEWILRMNRELANQTVFQSRYSLQKHLDLGYEFVEPVIIPNAADPSLFHPHGRVRFDPRRKVRLISMCWSNNPNKGAATYQWLDRNLDWSRYEYTFVGRSPVSFERIRTHPPVDSQCLADLLRSHDIFITASRDDPCSNAVVEALSCGLPVIYLDSGGHPELVKEGGLPFVRDEEARTAIERLVDEYEAVQSRIQAPRLSRVADDYLRVMGLTSENRSARRAA